MRKIILFYGLSVAALFTACKSDGARSDDSTAHVIDVANAVTDCNGIKVSQIGSNVRYVPLETADSAMISDKYELNIVGNYVAVTNTGGTTCMIFDKKTGKYITSVGAKGEGPEEYGSPSPIVDYTSGTLWFKRSPDRMLNFNTNGRYLGDMRFNDDVTQIESIVWTDSLAYAHSRDWNDKPSSVIYCLNSSGIVTDSLIRYRQPDVVDEGNKEIEASEIASIGVFMPTLYSTTRIPGVYIHIDFKDGHVSDRASSITTMWQIDSSTRFHEVFSDTVFNYAADTHALNPIYVFDTSDRHFDYEGNRDKGPTDKNITIHNILESRDKMLFVALEGSIGYNGKYYMCLYDKATGETSASYGGIVDDINRFVPFTPTTHTPEGEYATLITKEVIDSWIDKNGSEKLTGALEFVNDLDEEANPVLMIVGPENE